jgi:hypothetical protein
MSDRSLESGLMFVIPKLHWAEYMNIHEIIHFCRDSSLIYHLFSFHLNIGHPHAVKTFAVFHNFPSENKGS